MSAVAPAGHRILWQPWPGFQVRALSCGADEALLGGAAGPGKTDVLIALASKYGQHPHAAVLFLRTQYKDLLTVTDRMHRLLPSMGWKWNATEGRWHHRSGGTILMGHAENMKEASAYLGQEYTAVIWDEIGLLGDPNVWKELRTRVRSTDVTVPLRMRCSANPGGPGHPWLKAYFVTPCGKDGSRVVRDAATMWTRAYVPGRLRDNPSLPANYVLTIRGHTEMRRKQLEDGDWDAGEGLSFDVQQVHRIEPFRVPAHWTVFGAHDWGFAHYWSFFLFAVDEGGNVYLVDSTSAQGFQPDAIVDRVATLLQRYGWDFSRLNHTHAGHDIWNERKALGANAPTFAEEYAAAGWYCAKANTGRVLGANNIRHYLSYRTPDGVEKLPKFRLMETSHNERVWTMLETRVADPGDLEDVLKPKEGEDPEGLDDLYDGLRYGLASRPFAAVLPAKGDAIRDDFGAPIDYANKTLTPRAAATEEFRKQMDGGGNGLSMPRVGRMPRVA